MSKYASLLTVGAVQKIQQEDDNSHPVLQVLDYKMVKENRIRVYLWDGVEEFNYGMISSQMASIVEDGLKQFCLLRINSYNLSQTQGRTIVIIMDCEIAAQASDVQEKIVISDNQRKALTELANKPVAPTTTSTKSGADGPPGTPARSGRPPMMGGTPRTPSGSATMPISSLNPYQSRVTIRGRVSSKGDIKTWSKATGQGKLFSFEVLDGTGEIRITAFNEQVDKFYDMIKLKQVYYISGFQCKAANKNFRSNNNEYELTLGKFSNVELCKDADDEVPVQTFEFVKIADIEELGPDKLVDVCAVVKTVAEPQTFNRKSDGKPLTKRDITLVDDSCKAITMTLWNDVAQNFQLDGDDTVVVLTKARVNEFNGGVSISTGQSSSMELLGSNDDSKDISRVDDLRKWWKREGHSMDFESVRGSGSDSGGGNFAEEWMDFEIMSRRGDAMDMQEKPLYVWNRVTITMFNKENALYKACSADQCMKKVQEQGDGMYYCEKCGGQPSPNFKYRILLKLVTSDATKQFWATAFNEKAEQILGVTAANLGECMENDTERFDQIFCDAMFKEFHMKFRGKKDVYQEEARFQLAVVDAKEVKAVTDCKHLLKEIAGMGKLL